jgi:hypothetical protein
VTGRVEKARGKAGKEDGDKEAKQRAKSMFSQLPDEVCLLLLVMTLASLYGILPFII